MFVFNPISYGLSDSVAPTGGGLRGPPLAELVFAPKRIYISIWKFLTFLIYQNLNFEEKRNPIFLPHPPSEGGTKKMKIFKTGQRA